MRLLFLLMTLMSGAANAGVPNFKAGGLILGLQYGYGLWSFDRAHLGLQVVQSRADGFISDIQNTHNLGLRLGYNVLGHASIEMAVSATGWNLTEITRGGGGFITGALAWHPLALLWLKEEQRPVPIDLNIYFGAGWGIVGQRFGMDGLVFQTGFNAEYYFVKSIGVGLYTRGTFMNWSSFYLNYDQRSVPGNTIPLPQGSGGSQWQFGLSLLLRFEAE